MNNYVCVIVFLGLLGHVWFCVRFSVFSAILSDWLGRMSQKWPIFIGWPLVEWFALCYQTVVCLSVCNVGILWPNGWMDPDETWHASRSLPGHIVLDGDPASPPPKVHSPQFSAHICCGQMAGWIKMPHCVRWGPSFPSPKGTQPPIFGPYLLWPNGWMDKDATWYGDRPRPRRLSVRWGLSSPPQKGGRAPQFSSDVYCGQMARWIKMPLGMEVNLGPGDVVLDGVAAPP